MMNLEMCRVSRKDIILARLSYFALGIISVVLAVVLFWALTGTDALTVKQPVPLEPKIVQSAEKVTLKVTFCKHTNANGRLTQSFISDKTRLLTPTTSEAIPAGCYTDYPITVPIPPQTTPGIYQVEYHVEYQTNPLHHITEDFVSESFQIVANEN